METYSYSKKTYINRKVVEKHRNEPRPCQLKVLCAASRYVPV